MLKSVEHVISANEKVEIVRWDIDQSERTLAN